MNIERNRKVHNTESPAGDANATKKRKRVMLKWPSGFRALRKLLNWGCSEENSDINTRAPYDKENQSRANDTSKDANYEGGSAENQVAPMVQFYPGEEEPKSMEHNGKEEQGLVEMAQLPKTEDGSQNNDFETARRSMCPKFRITTDPDSVAVEWLDYTQDIFDKFILTIIICGLVFFADQSVKNKPFKPFTVWVVVVALTSVGDIVGNFGASIPGNRCAWLVFANLLTGLGCLAMSVLSFIKGVEHQTVWDAIEKEYETGDNTWFIENAEWVQEMNKENPDWQDDWTGMTSVDWGHAAVCLILSLAELCQAGFIVFLKQDGGGDSYGQGNEKFKKAQAISTIFQSVIQVLVMGIAWGVEGHLVKPDYMAALITMMVATDKFFDNVTELGSAVFEDEDDFVSCGVLGNQIFKVVHNAGLAFFAWYLSSYAQDLYFFIENREIDNLEQLADSKNWFNNATKIGDYYDEDDDGMIDGLDPTENGNYCTMKLSPWNALGYQTKLVYCAEYKYDAAKGYGEFSQPMDFATIFSDDFHPTDGVAWGKMKALWGDVRTNLCPEQCSTPSLHYLHTHDCDPTLCNFHKLEKEGDKETSISKIPVALQPLDSSLKMGESIQDENEEFLTYLQWQRFDLTFLFKFFIWTNVMQAGQSIIGLFVLFKLVSVSCVLTVMVIIGGYVCLFLDVAIMRAELIIALLGCSMIGFLCWYFVRSEKAKGME